jgi:hypothetical protein
MSSATVSADNQAAEPSVAIQLDGYRCQNREGEQLESESDQEADEPMVADDHAGPWTHLIDSLHEEINNALRREHFRDASELQRMVRIIMDNLNAGNLRIDAAKNPFSRNLPTGWRA